MNGECSPTPDPPITHAPPLDHPVTAPVHELSLSLGEVLACTEALALFYRKKTKAYLEMRGRYGSDHPVLREQLWQITHARNCIERCQSIVEGTEVGVLAELRELELTQIPQL